jgi:tyrosine/nicotianamine family aminotransferase
MSYAIRELVPLAKEIEKRGKNIIYLNIGDPLRYDFKTPSHIINALYLATLENKNYYSESQGILELREAITKHEKKINGVSLEPDNIVVTQGVSEGIIILLRILLEPGDNIAVPSPSYPLYVNIPKIYDSSVIEYKLDFKNEWEPDIDNLRKSINDRTKALVIVNPNNPTGAVFSEKIVRELVNIAGEFGIPIISDEIYNQLVYEDKKFVSPVKISKDVPIFVLNGFSKAYLMTGWRIGYLYLHDPTNQYIDEATNLILKMVRIRLSCNTPAQYAALAALKGPQDHIQLMKKKLLERIDMLHKYLSDTNYFDVVRPGGGFYIFPKLEINNFRDKDKDFVISLLKEEGVFTVFGSGFGIYGRGFFRIVTLPPPKIIEEAIARIDRFCKKHSGG